MEQGVIFTEDKKDIQVFFLKPQQLKPLIDDSIESDNKDCHNDDSYLMNVLDVNENYAGGGVHWSPLEKAHLSYLGGGSEHPPPYLDDPPQPIPMKKYNS